MGFQVIRGAVCRGFTPLSAPAFCALCLGAAQADEAVQLSAGPAGYVLPLYPGAARSRTLWFPMIDAEINGRFYMNASDLAGIYAYKSALTQVGAAIEYDPMRRRALDDPRLRGLPDVKETAQLKCFGAHTMSILTLEQNVASDILGRGQGVLAQTNLWATAPIGPRVTVNLGPGVTWTNSRFMQSFFAVSASEQGISPALHRYSARAGLLDTHLNALAEWQLPLRLRISMFFEQGQLRGEAAQSPITVRHSQNSLLTYITYRLH